MKNMNIEKTLEEVYCNLKREGIFKQAPMVMKIFFMEHFIHETVDRMKVVGVIDDFISDSLEELPPVDELTRYRVMKWCDERKKIKFYNDNDKYIRYYMVNHVEDYIKKYEG